MSVSDAEADKLLAFKFPRFHGKRGEDYGLWRLRLRAALRVRILWSLTRKSSEPLASQTISEAYQALITLKLQKASRIIISAVRNSPLQVIAEVDDEPCHMLELLDARYACNRTVCRIAAQTQLILKRYTNQDMAMYINEDTSNFSQLEFMGKDAVITESHQAPMILASIEPTCALGAIAAAMWTKNTRN